jgi:hypothetical protein
MAMLFVTSEPAAAAPIALTASQFAADPSLYQAVAAQAAAMFYGALPPEINSARMYAGPGRYHGIWGLAGAVAAVVAPILASYSLMHGGRPLVAATTVLTGFIGAALCVPLARALAGRTDTTS